MSSRKASCAIQAALLTALLATGSASAAIVQVRANNFSAEAGLITFSEFALGTQNPIYEPSRYGGGNGAPTVSFGGLFTGQSLSPTPQADCPGGAPTACIVGSPSGTLSLDPASPFTATVTDAANATSPVLSGSPLFNGPIAVLFDVDLAGVGFDAGFFDAIGSAGITAFARDGSLLGTITNSILGIEFLGLVTADGSNQIAGVFLDLVGAEPEGFAIDNLRFGRAGQVAEPGGALPEPATLALLGLGLAGLGAARRLKRR